jgi:flagellar M-ring protein FliF
VPGQIPSENVTVLDGNGRDVSSTTGTASKLGTTELKLSLERELESVRENDIVRFLEPIFGEGKVRVTVRCTIDIDKKIKEIINYYPNEDNKGVLSGESGTTEIIRDEEATGGVPGTESNAEIPVYPGVTVQGDEVYFNSQWDMDYLVSQMMEQVESDSYSITDMAVSVAIDSPQLSAARVDDIKGAIANIAGISAVDKDTKIAILSDQFIASDGSEEPVEPWNEVVFLWFSLKDLIVYGGIALLFIVLLVVIFVAAGKAKKNKEKNAGKPRQTSGRAQQTLGYAAEPEYVETVAPIGEVANSREAELKNQIGEFSSNNPDISAQLIRTWLKGVEE